MGFSNSLWLLLCGEGAGGGGWGGAGAAWRLGGDCNRAQERGDSGLACSKGSGDREKEMGVERSAQEMAGLSK